LKGSEEQQRIITEVASTGRWRKTKPVAAGERRIMVPASPEALVQAVIARLGPEQAGLIYRLMGSALHASVQDGPVESGCYVS